MPTMVDMNTVARVNRVAHKAYRLFPGPVGKHIMRELHSITQFRWLASTDSATWAMLEQIEQLPEGPLWPREGA